VHRGDSDQWLGEGQGSRPALGPAAVIVSGPPASGKTTLATALARATRYVLIDLDTVTGPLTRAALRASGGDESAVDSPAGEQLRAARYETLLDVAAANLEIGLGVVMAAPFTRERSSSGGFRDVVQRLRGGDPQADVALLYIDTPDDVAGQRLSTRNAPRDRAKLSPPLARTPPAPLVPDALVLDGTQSLAAQLAQALDALARPGNRLADEPRAEPC
jgi:predicted kinase